MNPLFFLSCSRRLIACFRQCVAVANGAPHRKHLPAVSFRSCHFRCFDTGNAENSSTIREADCFVRPRDSAVDLMPHLYPKYRREKKRFSFSACQRFTFQAFLRRAFSSS